MDIFRFVGDVGVEVMTIARCGVDTVHAVAAAARLVTITHTHHCHLN